MPETDQGSEMEQMGEKNDDTMADPMSDQTSEDMAEDSDEMVGHNDDAMMEDGGEMMDEEGEDMEKKEDEMSGDMEMGEGDADMSEDKSDNMTGETMMSPGWFDATLKDARTGEPFTISDFKGKIILVETLAMWCSNCFKQQGEVVVLHELLGERDDFISLGIDIDPNENAEALKGYIDKNGFSWRYTVAPIEVAREIGQLYGNQFLNPPSTPMLIIDRHGEVHTLPFGIKSADSLLDALQPFLDADM
jgi:hypothetical protein